MVLTRPTLATLIGQAQQEIGTGLGVSPILSRSVEAVLARTLALLAHGLYGQLEKTSNQLFPTLADAAGLEQWAAVYGLSRKPSVEAFGSASFGATLGSEMPAGTLVRSTTGQDYTVADTVTAQAGGSIQVDLLAVVGGLKGNASTGQKLALVSPIAGITNPGTVIAPGLIGGLDAETDDQLRERLLVRIRNAPKGGAAADYATWALEVQGITRAWVYPLWAGPGTVGVTFVLDGQAGSILPNSTKVAEVLAYLNARRPVTAQVFAFAPTLAPVNLTIALQPNTAEVKAAVAASLADLFSRESEPGGTIGLQALQETISTTPGETAHQILTPTADIVAAAGTLPTLGVITWA